LSQGLKDVTVTILWIHVFNSTQSKKQGTAEDDDKNDDRKKATHATLRFLMPEYLTSRGQGKSTSQACTSWMNFSLKKQIALMDLELDLLLLEITNSLDDGPLYVVLTGWEMVMTSLKAII
jgi:hypothetical protein